MLRKINRTYYALMVLLGLVTLYFREPLLIILLVLFPILAWLFRDFKLKEQLENAQSTLHKKKKEVETKVLDTDTKLKKLFNAIPSPVVYINQRGDFEVWNTNYDQLFEEIPKNVYDVTIEASLKRIMLDAFLNEKQFTKQFNYRSSDYQVHSIPILTDKRYSGYLLIFQDVTRLAEAERIQKRFIADASHELRTPITSIKGMIEIINRPDFDDEQTQQEFLLQIEKDTERLNQIVKDLLLQSKLNANKVYLEKTVFNLHQFFEGLIYTKRQKLHKNNIKTRLNCPSNITIYADQFRLSQVFINLLNNAINYSENGMISIDCEEKFEDIIITFSDTGEGIEEASLPYIFDRFYRSQTDRSHKEGGSGLGLAISKSIIEAHGGTLEVTSEYGVGTTFIIKLTQN